MARKRSLNSEIVVSSGGAAAAPVRRAPSRRGTLTRPGAEGDGDAAQAVSAAVEPTREEIAALAYSYWEQRGGKGGSPEEDWARAERTLRQRVSVLVA